MKLFFTLLSCLWAIDYAAAQTNCDSWLLVQNRFAAITVGDLDVTGNQVTVEATFNMTGPSVNIVSKHKGGSDLNYLLRPTRAEIATDISGFVFTGQGNSPCNDQLELNKTYHAALVYDGSSLKFYRNGALISQVPAFGNLITNNWNTAIGEHAPVVTPFVNGMPNPEYHDQNINEGYYDESFRGFINEVRIWNVARTQNQIKAYMNTSLPNPATQVGLMGYWVMNDLHNRQGNTTYDGSVEGLAAINQTNTNCTFRADSCNILLPVRLTDFNTVINENNGVKISWHTEEEVGIKNYTLQRSSTADFRNFTALGVFRAIGNSRGANYSFTDNTLNSNKIYYYRLQINELNGGQSYSAIRSAKVSKQSFVADIYPNPVQQSSVNVRFNNMEGSVSVQVINNTGQLLMTKNANISGGNNIVTLDLNKYQKGNYFISILTKDNRIVKKIVRL